MTSDHLLHLLEDVRDGTMSPADARERLRTLPYDALDAATLDTHRVLRRGIPEAVYSPGKTPEQIAEIMERLAESAPSVLATRATPDVADAVSARLPGARYHETARVITLKSADDPGPLRPGITVVTAGTADLPVAEEAAVTAEAMGQAVERVRDVGVAGLHRLLTRLDDVRRARVIVVVAGMDGALPSVVAGLVAAPVIAVPTSTGYGASFGGIAPLLTMLNSCAEGVAVVNIDNGYGAGIVATLINRVAQ